MKIITSHSFYNIKYRTVTLLIALTTFAYTSCKDSSSATSSNEEAVAATEDMQDAVQAQIMKIYEATSKQDIDTVLSYTHDSVIDLMGGKKQAKALIVQAFAAIESVKMEKPTFPEKVTYLKSEENEFVVVPVIMEMTVEGKRMEITSYQVGARKIGSSDWKYIGGDQLKGGGIHGFIPDFPKDHKLPATSMKPLN